MFNVIVSAHWKSVRVPLLLATVVGFALPLLSVKDRFWAADRAWETGAFLGSLRQWGATYPLLAAAVGLLLGATAWTRDHRGKHVYALTLPIPRWKYALILFGAGAVLLSPVVITVAAGSLLAVSFASIPDGLTAYPIALTIRFALTGMLAFAMFFAISAGTPRTAGVVLGGLTLLVGTHVFVQALGWPIDFWTPVVDRLLQWPGPFDAFGGQWMLIDV